ncbi:MAG: hypothetical protein ACFFG0_18355 [Candidatus Thorarchaeota archaeon]
MGLKFGICKDSYKTEPKLKRVKRGHFNFKFEFNLIFLINALVEKELFANFSDFFRYALRKQYQKIINGGKQAVIFDLHYFFLDFDLKRSINVKLASKFAEGLRLFCNEIDMDYSQFFRYAMVKELQLWEKELQNE